MSKNIHKENILKLVQYNAVKKFETISNIYREQLADDKRGPTPQEVQLARWSAGLSLKAFEKALTTYVGPEMTTPDTALTPEERATYVKGNMVSTLQEADLIELVKEKAAMKTAEDEKRYVEEQAKTIMAGWKLADEFRQKDPARAEAGVQRLLKAAKERAARGE